MKIIRTLIITILLFSVSYTSHAQQVVISPLPQSSVSGTKAFDRNTAVFKINGANLADSNAVNLLKNKISIDTTGIELIIGEKGDNNLIFIESEIPDFKNGYLLKVDSNRVIIAGKDSVGTFYGVQSFLQLMSAPEVMQTTIRDYPDTQNRGAIEGFYGNPWSHNDRIRLFEFMGRNKMDIYVYSPKDDPYHNSQWSVFYPNDLALKMKELVQKASSNKVKFVWAIHLGGKGVTSPTQYAQVIAKFENMYKLGVRHFAVFYDDSGTETAAQQCEATNYLVNNFVKKKNDVGDLLFCPTGYNRAWASTDYLTTLGNYMDPSVMIYWTGNSVVDMINYSDMTYINGYLKRNAFIWLNYPVTDYCIDHLLMGPTYGNDLTISKLVSGFTSNPMEYCEASKVSLYSIADYTWNMSDYNAQNSWLRAIKFLMPENSAAFKIFCENNIDLGSTYHGLRRSGESAAFKTVADLFMTDYKAGRFNQENADALSIHFQSFRTASAELLSAKDNLEMTAEIKPWLQVFDIIGAKGLSMMKMYFALQNKDSISFIQEYQRVDSLENQQKLIISRGYAGSIKSPNPKPANEVVAPFLKTFKLMLINDYKRNYKYMIQIFPKIVLEEGKYFIKYNGAYLTNKTTTPGNPTYLGVRDNVNPQRQEWIISADPTTDRFKIVNAQDSRYVNELGNFGTNVFDASWNTYNIYRLNNRYAIQNGGNGGDKFWNTNTTRISISTNNQIKTGNFVFEIIPVDGDTIQYPKIESGKNYFIRYNNKYLTKSLSYTTTPTFNNLISIPSLSQKWKLLIDGSTERYKIVFGSDTTKYINEIGNFGTNPYYSTWNSYVITELGGKFAIQNAGDAGSAFWTVSTGNTITKGSAGRAESYLFEILPEATVFATDVKNNYTPKHSWVQTNNKLIVEGHDISGLTLISLQGSTIRQITGKNELSLEGITSGIYLLRLSTYSGSTEVIKLMKM